MIPGHASAIAAYGLLAVLLGVTSVWALQDTGPHSPLIAVLTGVSAGLALLVAAAFVAGPGTSLGSLAVFLNLLLSLVWNIAAQGLVLVGVVVSISRGQSVLGDDRRTWTLGAVFFLGGGLHYAAVKRLNVAIDHWR
ncbi:hypothetical protein ACFCX4_32270 [Kitasatospora sp. NPDC056327]|uniref:hypothetical protein n=1 Tax=Kitasatospora sp. NPDC056327 TaxID=3345785 RepID=UPI0035D6067F